MKRINSLLCGALLLVVLFGCTQKVSDKKVIQFKYKGTLTDGTVITSSDEAGTPYEVMIGSGSFNPVIQTQLMGMKVGEKKSFLVKAADIFGEYNPENVVEVPKEYVPTDAAAGMVVVLEGPSGPVSGIILEVKSKSAIVDLNSPYAGKDVTFDVEIVSIRNPTKDELQKALSAQSAAAAQEQ